LETDAGPDLIEKIRVQQQRSFARGDRRPSYQGHRARPGSRYTNSSGDIDSNVVTSRQGVCRHDLPCA